jgi:hypothetical protein
MPERPSTHLRYSGQQQDLGRMKALRHDGVDESIQRANRITLVARVLKAFGQ